MSKKKVIPKTKEASGKSEEVMEKVVREMLFIPLSWMVFIKIGFWIMLPM